MILGSGLLAAAGIVQLWKGRLSGPTPTRRQLLSDPEGIFTVADRRNPRRILTDRAKLANLIVVCCEFLIMAMAAFMLIYTTATFAIPTVAAVTLALTYVLGAYLLSRVIYLRLGFGTGPDVDEERPSVPVIEASLADAFGESVEDDFAAITGAMRTARGDEGLGVVTAALLAAARGQGSIADVREWCVDAGVASAETVDERAGELTEAGVFEETPESGPITFSDERLADVDPDQVATVTASVLE